MVKERVKADGFSHIFCMLQFAVVLFKTGFICLFFLQIVISIKMQDNSLSPATHISLKIQQGNHYLIILVICQHSGIK